MAEYLELADYLLIAEAVLEVPASVIARSSRIDLAESALHAPAAAYAGIEFYPDLAMKAAVRCNHLARNHPLPDGNKRAAYLSMLEFLYRNGVEWPYRASDDEIVSVMEATAAGTMPQDQLRDWLRGVADF